MPKITVALLSGGISSEREVSLNSGNQVYDALDKEKYNVLRYDPKTDLPKLVADASRIDVALIILHGPYGEDGTVQGLLDLLGIPYQGSGVMSSAIAMNKLISKQLYEKAGLPVPPYLTIQRQDKIDENMIVERIGLPMVIKPVEGGSSIGISIIKTADELENALDLAFEQDNTVLVEAFMNGPEITCGVLGNSNPEALPLIEIIPGDEYNFFDYNAKYLPGATQEICPARINDTLTAKAQSYGVMAHNALQCQGYSRTDFILVENEFYVLETNTIPGMTATSLFPQSAQAAGLDFSQLLDRLLELGMEGRRQSSAP
jgi:D-alanine-D-alanine ligase